MVPKVESDGSFQSSDDEPSFGNKAGGRPSSSNTQPQYENNDGPQIIVNITLYESMKQWFEFHFPSATVTYALSSVMEHLTKIGLPIEYIEEQFYLN